MDKNLISALAIAVASIVVGAITASILRRSLGAESRRSEVRDVAPAIGSLVFWTFVAVGIVVAVGITSPKTLEPIPAQLVLYLPRVLVGGLWLIMGKVLGVLASAAVGQTMQRATGKRQFGVERAIQSVTLVLSVLLALTQLGINTDILNMFVAGLIGAISLAAALLAGFGGRQVASHIAAGRSMRRVIRPGSHLSSGNVSGLVLEMHPVTVELQSDDGQSLHVPYGELLRGPVQVVAASAIEEDENEGDV